MQEKDALRKIYKAEKINGRIWKDFPDVPFNTLLSFIPLEGEVDVRPFMLQAQKRGLCVAVPTSDYRYFSILDSSWEEKIKRLENGTFSVDGPTLDIRNLSDEKVVILVPALACTKSGLRLGRGGGFYDRVLSVLSKFPNVKSICVVPKERIVQTLPEEEHDRRVSMVIGV